MAHKIIQIPDDFNGIMIVGEGPSAEDVQSVRFREDRGGYFGHALLGFSGKFFREACQVVDFPLDKCVVTNTVHENAYKNNWWKLSKEAQDFGEAELIADIKLYQPRLIIAVGERALNVLTGKTNIKNYRGTVVPSTLVEGYNVFSTISPSFIFRGEHRYDIVLKIDLKKSLGDLSNPDYNIKVIYDKFEALENLHALCYETQLCSVDIETAGPKLLSFGVATSITDAIVITKELCMDVEVLKAISKFCDSGVPMLFHNALYDVFYLAYYYKIFTRNIFADSMLAQHAIFPTLLKSLAFCSSLYTNAPYWKDEGTEVIKDYKYNKVMDWPAFYIYNGKDCCVTLWVHQKQQQELDDWGTRPAYDLMMRAVPYALVSMLNGLHVNWDNQKKFKADNEKAIEVINKISFATIGDVNLNSSTQCIKLLYEHWKLPKQYTVTKGKKKLTSGKLKIQYLETLPTNVQPLVGMIKKTRELIKLRGFYNLTVDEDGLTRFSQKIHGAYTGRWATSKCITGSGMNFQNQPKAIRCIYKPPSGKIFLQWDLSNSEARIVSALCQDEAWLKSFDEDDQHSVVTEKCFGIPREKVRTIYSGGKTYRDYGKKIAHARHYLEQPTATAAFLGCSRVEAKRLGDAYGELHPSLGKWHAWVNTEVRRTRIIRTCFNRVIQFFGPFFDSHLAEAIACEPQSTSGDYLNHGLMDCFDQIPELAFAIQVHDSGMCSVDNDPELLKTIIPKIQKIMERRIVVRGLEFLIPVDFEIGLDWYHMKEIKDFNKIDEVWQNVTGE